VEASKNQQFFEVFEMTNITARTLKYIGLNDERWILDVASRGDIGLQTLAENRKRNSAVCHACVFPLYQASFSYLLILTMCSTV